MGATLTEGRTFGVQDSGEAGAVVVVDEAYARRAFPGVASVAGREIHATRYLNGQFVNVPATIVGVVRSMRDDHPTRPSAGQVFWSFAQSPRWELTFAVRLAQDDPSWADRVHTAVSSVHPDLAVADVTSLDRLVSDALAPLRFASMLGGIFSILALLLAFLGLYSVVSYSTRQRFGEIGIRLALGAGGGLVFRDVVKEGVQITLVGIALGIVATFIVARPLEGILFGVSSHEPVVLSMVAGGLVLVGLAATALPAAHAARLDPTKTLRP